MSDEHKLRAKELMIAMDRFMELDETTLGSLMSVIGVWIEGYTKKEAEKTNE